MSWRGLALVDGPRSGTRLCVLGLTCGLGSLGQKHFSEGHGVSVAVGDVHSRICCGALTSARCHFQSFWAYLCFGESGFDSLDPIL